MAEIIMGNWRMPATSHALLFNMEFKDMLPYTRGLKEVGLDKEQRREYVTETVAKNDRYKNITKWGLIGIGGTIGAIEFLTPYRVGWAAAVGLPLACAAVPHVLEGKLQNNAEEFIRLTRPLINSRQTGKETDAGLEQAIKVLNKIV